MKIANSRNGNLLLKRKQNKRLLAIKTPSFVTTYGIDDFNGRDTTSKIKIQIDEMNLPECQDFIIKIDFEKFEKNEIKKSLFQKISHTPMINEKQKICINCH